MDSYQGSIYDPVSLHKYLYANANPVMYTDSSGYSANDVIALEGRSILTVGQAWNESVMFRIGMKLLSQVYAIHGEIIVRVLYTTAIASLLLNPDNLKSIERWANCINIYAQNDSISEIPDDVDSENSEVEKEGNDSPEGGEEEEYDEELGALDQLGKDLENAYKRNGSKISEEEARIIDELCKEYGKSQHHDTDYYYEHPHWKEPHTHIGNRHIPFQ